RREERRGARQGAAAVEKTRHGVGEQGTAGGRARHHVGLPQELRWQKVDQILRETPDDRRLTEQLMRVQVDAPVVAVAEIEVAVAHQHVVLLQFAERFLAYLVSFAHSSPGGPEG